MDVFIICCHNFPNPLAIDMTDLMVHFYIHIFLIHFSLRPCWTHQIMMVLFIIMHWTLIPKIWKCPQTLSYGMCTWWNTYPWCNHLPVYPWWCWFIVYRQFHLCPCLISNMWVAKSRHLHTFTQQDFHYNWIYSPVSKQIS